MWPVVGIPAAVTQDLFSAAEPNLQSRLTFRVGSSAKQPCSQGVCLSLQGMSIRVTDEAHEDYVVAAIIKKTERNVDAMPRSRECLFGLLLRALCKLGGVGR